MTLILDLTPYPRLAAQLQEAAQLDGRTLDAQLLQCVIEALTRRANAATHAVQHARHDRNPHARRMGT